MNILKNTAFGSPLRRFNKSVEYSRANEAGLRMLEVVETTSLEIDQDQNGAYDPYNSADQFRRVASHP